MNNRNGSISSKDAISITIAVMLIVLAFVVGHALGFRNFWESIMAPRGIQAIEDGDYEAAIAIFEPLQDFGDCDDYFAEAQAKFNERNANYQDALNLIYLGEYRDAYNILSQYDDEAANVLSEYCKMRIVEEEQWQ